MGISSEDPEPVNSELIQDGLEMGSSFLVKPLKLAQSGLLRAFVIMRDIPNMVYGRIENARVPMEECRVAKALYSATKNETTGLRRSIESSAQSGTIEAEKIKTSKS